MNEQLAIRDCRRSVVVTASKNQETRKLAGFVVQDAYSEPFAGLGIVDVIDNPSHVFFCELKAAGNLRQPNRRMCWCAEWVREMVHVRNDDCEYFRKRAQPVIAAQELLKESPVGTIPQTL